MAVTRASDRLYLSYAAENAEGRPVLPSFFLEEVRSCFPALLVERPIDRFLTEPEQWETEPEISQGLAHIFLSTAPIRPDLRRRLRPVFLEWKKKERFAAVLRAAGPEVHAELRDPRVLAALGKVDTFSATRLETYATCAFKYFCERTLKLNQPLHGREDLEMGNLLHTALEQFYKEIPEEARSRGSLWDDRGAMKTRLVQQLDEAMRKSPFRHEPVYRQKMYRASMVETLLRFADAEARLHRQRGLVPAYFEFQFGRGKERNFLRIPGPEGDIRLEGRMDRIDVLASEKKALVVDYKRSARPGSVQKKLKSGLEFQLPIYLLALKRILGYEPLGAELRYLRSSEEEGIYLESGREQLGLNPKRKTLSEEEVDQMLRETEDSVRVHVKRLRSGDISVRSKNCDFCRFDSVCRFQKWRLIYSSDENR